MLSAASRSLELQVAGAPLRVDLGFVADFCAGDPAALAFASGSLVEGIGNPFSDVDVYVVREELPRSDALDLSGNFRVIGKDRSILREDAVGEPVYLIHRLIPGSYVKIDIEFRTFAEVTAVVGTIDELFAYATHNLVLLTRYMNYREEDLIHRILGGVPIANEAAFSQLRSAISAERYAYLCYRWNASDFSVLIDLLGAWRVGEWDRARDLARENLIQQMSAFLHLNGLTNKRRKWLLRYLSLIEATHPALTATFRDLIFFRLPSGAQECRAYVVATLDLVDEIFRASSAVLEKTPAYPSGAAAIRQLELETSLRSDQPELAEMEFRYRTRAYGALLPPTRKYLDAA